MNNMIFIKAATEEYMPRILEIEQEAFSPPWTHGALSKEIYGDDSFFAVAVAENDLLSGFVLLRRLMDEGELLKIAVDKTARRRGVAELLIKTALQNADQHALKSIFLEVRESNAAAIALYKKFGFKLMRQRKDYYTDPIEDALVMALEMADG